MPRRRHRLKGSVSVAAALGAWLLTALAPVQATDLAETLVKTYLSNPELAAGRAELRQTDELVPQALAGYRPSLFLNGGVEGVAGTAKQDGGVVGSANRSASSVGVTLQQNLYAGGGTQASVSRAENLVTAQRSRLLALEQQVLLDAVDAHTAVYRDRRVLELALNNEERLGRQLEATRDRFEVGEVARTDVAQAEARLSRARADIETAKADLAASRALYQRVVGEEPRDVENAAPLRELPATFEEASALAADNPDVIAATYDLYAARDEVDVAFADLLPSIDLRADAAHEEQPTVQTRWGRSAALGVTLSIPLYQGGAEQARVRESRQRVRQRRDQLENAHRSVQELVTASWERLLAATAAIDAFDAEVRANRIALEGVEQEALVGARTVLDVLDAEQELFTSQVNLVRAQREEVLASYQLKLAVGQLTVTDLALPVEPYDPTAYYRRQRTRLFGLD